MSVAENMPTLSRLLEIMRKLHLFVSIQQPQLHILIFDLKSQLTDIYLDSKVAKQSSITLFIQLLISLFSAIKIREKRSNNVLQPVILFTGSLHIPRKHLCFFEKQIWL